ncbi:MAG: transposase [Candidatus Absconditabacteria bacterium]|nr:transposase [Candidatus Absconditabacteria bacterium]MDD3868810.1 transposase [Candidatus Absconditabacteria bacterium]MDD4714191.1 transposase [Candidatus Absconditabacteria bacterium]
MPTRLPFQGNSYYHVYNRGLDKATLFYEEKDFERFLYYFSLGIETYKSDLGILAYAFLPNHFHIIFHNKREGHSISRFISKLTSSYAKYATAKYGFSTGKSFFEGRFKSKLITDETYLNQCIFYVEHNALKHQLVEKAEEWAWSSYDTSSHKDGNIEWLELDREF